MIIVLYGNAHSTAGTSLRLAAENAAEAGLGRALAKAFAAEGDWHAFAEPSPGPSGRQPASLTAGPRWFEHRTGRLAPRFDRAPAVVGAS